MKQVVDLNGNKIMVEDSVLVRTENNIHYLLSEQEMLEHDLQEKEFNANLIESNKQSLSQQRNLAYEKEADPLFFQWQRGEVDKQAWLDKIDEIRRRYS